MSNEPPELDRETAERLISDAAGDPELASVAELLTAATAPAYPDELTGMDAALAAFRQGRPPGARACGPRLIRRVLGVKAAVATLTVATVGGVAFAAGTGTLPVTLTDDRTAGKTSSAPPGPPSAPTPSGRRSGRLTPPGAQSTPTRQALIGLCRAYGADRRTSAPQALADAAGGHDKVPAYCTTVLRSRPVKRVKTPGGQTQDGQTQDGQDQDGQDQDGQTQSGQTQDGQDQDGQDLSKTARTTPAPTVPKPR